MKDVVEQVIRDILGNDGVPEKLFRRELQAAIPNMASDAGVTEGVEKIIHEMIEENELFISDGLVWMPSDL